MPEQHIAIKWMTDAIGKASRSENFSAHGVLPADNLGLHVEGVGAVKLPQTARVAKQLSAVGKAAPYGKGTKTLEKNAGPILSYQKRIQTVSNVH